MNAAFLESLTSHPLILAIGWTLVHFVWQAALVAIIVALVLGAMRQSSARRRYSMGLVGLALMTLLPIGTFACFISISDRNDWNIPSHLVNVEMPVPESREFIPASQGEIEFSVSPVIIPRWPLNESADALPGAALFDRRQQLDRRRDRVSRLG